MGKLSSARRAQRALACLTQHAGFPDAQIEITMAVDVVEKTRPANAVAASAASLGQARLRASMPTVVHSNKGLVKHLREQEI